MNSESAPGMQDLPWTYLWLFLHVQRSEYVDSQDLNFKIFTNMNWVSYNRKDSLKPLVLVFHILQNSIIVIKALK